MHDNDVADQGSDTEFDLDDVDFTDIPASLVVVDLPLAEG
jgi:hypothetical protein